jgi:hypothetical protein
MSFCAGLQIRLFTVMSGYLRYVPRGGTLVVSVLTCPSPVVGADVATKHPAQLSRGAVDDPAGIGAHTHLLEAGQRPVVISLQRTWSAGLLG